jgi:hypothetical protein
VLQKAAALLGGRKQLCRRLHVPAKDLQKWIDDAAVPPQSLFLRAVDLILDETPAPPSDSDANDPPAPREAAAGGGYSSRDFFD